MARAQTRTRRRRHRGLRRAGRARRISGGGKTHWPQALRELESRTFVPEFSTRVINSPGEPGIDYNMGVGFPRAISHPLLAQMRQTAETRNRELVRRVNASLKPVELDYDKDVLLAHAQRQRDRTAHLRSLFQKRRRGFLEGKTRRLPVRRGKIAGAHPRQNDENAAAPVTCSRTKAHSHCSPK